MADNVYSKEEAKIKIINGFSKTCRPIRACYGGAGSNTIIEHNLYPYHIVTNDGKSIVDPIILEDKIENIGANINKEIGDKADKDSGDGRKTTMILAEEILKESLKFNENPILIKRSLDECVPLLHKFIDDIKLNITPDDVSKVATTASENENTGRIIQEIYKEIGRDGIIEIDNSNTFETLYEIKEGVRLRHAGYMAPYMANEGEKAVYKKPNILITKQKIATTNDLEVIFNQLHREGTSQLVVFCEEIDMGVLGMLAFTHVSGSFKTLVIKAPKLWKDWVFEDFAKITGATIVSPENGISLKTVEIKHLGTCESLVSTRDETTVLGIKDISEHISVLEELSKKDENLKLRISWLKTKAAVLKVGANSESELSYVMKKTRDGVSASYLALQDGVVAGGGTTLVNALKVLPNTIGGNILRKVLLEPIRVIVKNAGYEITHDETMSVFGVKKDDKYYPITDGYGFDVKNLVGVDMLEAGIIDPALVIKNAIKNAISVAGTVLTADPVITLPQKTEDKCNMPAL